MLQVAAPEGGRGSAKMSQQELLLRHTAPAPAPPASPAPAATAPAPATGLAASLFSAPEDLEWALHWAWGALVAGAAAAPGAVAAPTPAPPNALAHAAALL